jgi:hypothetical protein
MVGSNYARRQDIFNSLLPDKPREYKIIRVGEVTEKKRNAEYVGRLSSDRVFDLDLESQVTIIVGRDFDFCNNLFSIPAGSPGPRFFEALMSGVNILYDAYSVDFDGNPDLKDYATPIYKRAELWNKIEILVREDSIARKAKQIEFAKNSQTYSHRAVQLLKIITQLHEKR